MILKVGTCKDISFVLKIIAAVLKVARWIVPILLIVLVSFDLYKIAVGNPDDKTKKDVTSTAVKRLVYAIIVFLIPTIITFALKTINSYLPKSSKEDAVNWISCWDEAYNNTKVKIEDHMP